MYLELPMDWDTQYSWGSAALAYLYRQDQASTRTKDTSSFCGFVWSLCVWTWERLPVGRPMLKDPDNPNPNPHEGLHDQDPYRRPTIAYCWDQVSVYTGSSDVRYKCYVNELDTLTAEQRYQLKLKPGWTQEEWSELVSEHPSAAKGGTSRSSRARRRHLTIDDTEEEEQIQEEHAREHEVDIDAPEPSQPMKKKKKGKDKTPRVSRKKILNSQSSSLMYPRKLLPKGMIRGDEEETSVEQEEEEVL
ncbi:Alpha-L-arabinofuranosidase 1 [Hordeum vulgare]|nr:Alpha-L-arabinofuranosidase 1 [Hordeum vulgare]